MHPEVFIGQTSQAITQAPICNYAVIHSQNDQNRISGRILILNNLNISLCSYALGSHKGKKKSKAIE